MSSWLQTFENGLGSRLVPTADKYGGGIQTYSPANVKVINKLLWLNAVRAADGSWTSGCVTTRNRLVFQYGKVEARIWLPSAKGVWPAFWMLGQNGADWPNCGEIDILEAVNTENVAYATAHSEFGSQTVASTHVTPNAWHTYAVDWQPDHLTFSVDDRLVGTLRASSFPGKWRFDPAYILLNLAIGGDWPGPPDQTTPASVSMFVYWLRVTW
jgi:beta-glucanase (GH16 family)